jgi:hypothetical protein
MQRIWLRGQLQESPPFLPPFSLVPDRLCDGSQTGGGQCHYGVTRSYLRGLQQVGHTFNFNPPNSSLYGDVIWALTSPACAAAASAKRERPAGEVFVVAGPQIGDIEECEDVDMVIVPSLWVKDRYISERKNAGNGERESEGKREQGRGRTKSSTTTARIVPLYAGVDTDFWRPRTPWSCKERQRIVLYDKSRVSAGSISSILIDQIEEILVHTGRPVDVVRYGFEGEAYTPAEFRDILETSFLAVFVSQSESQGLALTEAWSMDVPTLVWQGSQLGTGGAGVHTLSLSLSRSLHIHRYI